MRDSVANGSRTDRKLSAAARMAPVVSGQIKQDEGENLELMNRSFFIVTLGLVLRAGVFGQEECGTMQNES